MAITQRHVCIKVQELDIYENEHNSYRKLSQSVRKKNIRLYQYRFYSKSTKYRLCAKDANKVQECNSSFYCDISYLNYKIVESYEAHFI